MTDAARLRALGRKVDDAALLVELGDEDTADLPRLGRELAREAAELNGTGSAVSEEHGLRFFDMSELRARVEARPAGFLIEGLWPEDAYGVIGAEDKAGKSWAAGDLAVSVATATRWLQRYECAQGRALVLWGEGSDRNLLRRLDAICRGRGVAPGDLERAVRVALRVPRLDSERDVERVARELDGVKPRVTILDPLYLAAGAGKGRDLYAMGESLQAIQAICQDAGSALVVTTHWNQTGDGTGAQRFTGAGPSAWGRVLASAAVEQRKTEDGRSLVTLLWEFTGGEIPDTRFRMQRRVWADDPLDLASAMHYEVEITDEGVDAAPEGLTQTQNRVLLVLRSGEGSWTVKAVGDALAEDGHGPPLKERTIQKALAALVEKKLADGHEEEGKAGLWWAR